MSQATAFFTAKWPCVCDYSACAKSNVVTEGEQIVILGERRPRSEKTNRPIYHVECWKAHQSDKTDVTQEQKKLHKEVILSNVPPCKHCGSEATRLWKTETGEAWCDACRLTRLNIVEDPLWIKIVKSAKRVEASSTHEATQDMTQSNDLASMIAQAVAPLMKATASVDESKVIALIKQHSVPQPISVQITNDLGEIVQNMGLQHHSMPLLLNVMSARQASGFRLNIWLTGPAGSGKTTAASECAKALELPFYFTGALDNPYGLLGFVDANGKVVRTQFREAYEHGGVFLFDEIDGSTPSAVLPFNAALANGHCAFPDCVVERHPDFVCIAAANTWGLGATNDYVGRMKLDAASLDRFVQINWDIDEQLETATCGNPQWSARVQVIRARVRDKGIKVVVSPRASYFGSALLASGMPQSDVERLTLRKAMTEEQWQSVNSKTANA